MPQRKNDKLSSPTETVVVRGVDRELWQQFEDVCQMHGVTASQKIRQMIWETAKEGRTILSYLPETG
jgi:antitoxin component of RelBE/YafQ-DinJ toxin-antitoxin module